MPEHLDADVRPGKGRLRLRVGDERAAVELALRGDAQRAVEPRPQLDLPRQRRRAPLVAERVHGDLPAVAALPQQVLLGHDDVVEEQLRELGVTGDLRHRAHLEPGRSHVDDQHRDAAVLGRLRVGAREHTAPARVLAPRHPGLLAAHDEVVVVLDGARAQRREVGPGLGLGEALAPELLGGQDRRDVAPPLLVGPEPQQRRPEDVQADDVHELRRAGGCELLIDDDLLDGGAPAAAELGSARRGRRSRRRSRRPASRAGPPSARRDRAGGRRDPGARAPGRPGPRPGAPARRRWLAVS